MTQHSPDMQILQDPLGLQETPVKRRVRHAPDAQPVPGEQSAEFALVCACCSVAEGRAERIAAVLNVSPPGQARFLKIVERHRVAGLVFRALQNSDIPQDIREALADMARHQTLLATRLMLETVLVQRAMHRAGISVVFPKGVSLARRLYGDVAPRHTRDVDAFVAASDMPAAHAAMMAGGYRQDFPTKPFTDIRKVTGHSINYTHPARGLLIELHWAFDENPVLAPCPGHPGPLSPQAAATDDIATLPDTDLFLYLCLHGASHSWMRLKWLADMAALVPMLADDLPEIIKTAKARGLIRPVAAALILTRDLMGWTMPAHIAQALPHERAIEKLVRAGRRTLLHGGGLTSPYEAKFGTTRLKLDRLRLCPDLRFRRAEIRAILRGYFDADATPYLPAPLRPLLPVLKIPFWLVRQARR